jgi:two-component system NarL family sensor kinase
MIKNVILILLLLSIHSCTQKPRTINGAAFKRIDSLNTLSRNTSFTDAVRTLFLSKANNQINILKNDSLKARLLIKTAYSSLMLGDYKEYRNKSKQVLQSSLERNDTIALLKAYSFLGYYYEVKKKLDSVYYFYNKALPILKVKKDNVSEGRMLLGIGGIQESIKDYTGSEINAIKAISKLKGTDQYRNLYLAYNLLAVSNKNLGKFNLAIKNFDKSKIFLDKVKNNQYLYGTTLNNIGRVYLKQNNHTQAIENFTKGLKIKGLKTGRPKTYAMLLSNLGYSKFKLGGLTEVLILFKKALKIRDSLQIKDGMVASYHHLSEYYLSKYDTIKALQYGVLANSIAKEINYNDGLLESYKLLSKITQGTTGQQYLNKYIRLSDSLQHQERVVREKFTRIAYQTDEVIQENEKVQKKNYLLTLTLIIIVAFFILIYFLIKQRSRSRELEFAQMQDKSNIEIYNLMLSQQKMFNEGGVKEKNRISRDLHDGVLGRLFGARLSLDALNEGSSRKDIKEREKSIKELQSVEEEIREISHNLNSIAFNNESSFKELVEKLLVEKSKITNFEYQFSIKKDIDWKEIPNTIKINCYRILQEAIQNINKYSKAKTVKISFNKVENNLLVSIEDDGIGFDTKVKRKGIGLKNITSRVKDLGGNVSINSVKNKGTKITIAILLNI